MGSGERDAVDGNGRRGAVVGLRWPPDAGIDGARRDPRREGANGQPPLPKPVLPADVVAFRLKRDECDHLRGEEPTGPARAAFLKYGMERTCTGTDAALRALRQRHAHDPAAIAALAGYEDDIE
ncbi:hypothetical protein ACVOMT_14150 [Sphingomonas panni]